MWFTINFPFQVVFGFPPVPLIASLLHRVRRVLMRCSCKGETKVLHAPPVQGLSSYSAPIPERPSSQVRHADCRAWMFGPKAKPTPRCEPTRPTCNPVSRPDVASWTCHQRHRPDSRANGRPLWTSLASLRIAEHRSEQFSPGRQLMRSAEPRLSDPFFPGFQRRFFSTGHMEERQPVCGVEERSRRWRR
jgi:hypothetical protein